MSPNIELSDEVMSAVFHLYQLNIIVAIASAL